MCFLQRPSTHRRLLPEHVGDGTEQTPDKREYGRMVSDAPKALNRLGQSLWLDNITRDLLDSGTLKRYIDELSITGLTSNPTIFDHAISHSKTYDAAIGKLMASGLSTEDAFF